MQNSLSEPVIRPSVEPSIVFLRASTRLSRAPFGRSPVPAVSTCDELSTTHSDLRSACRDAPRPSAPHRTQVRPSAWDPPPRPAIESRDPPAPRDGASGVPLERATPRPWPRDTRPPCEPGGREAAGGRPPTRRSRRLHPHARDARPRPPATRRSGRFSGGKKRGPRASWRGDLERPVRDDGSGAYFGIAGVRPVFAPHGFAGFGWAGIGTAQVSFFFHTHWPSRTQICFDSVLYSAGTGMSL